MTNLVESLASAERRANASDCRGEVSLDEPSRQPQHANAERAGELRITRDIEGFEPLMHGPVDLDDEPMRRTVEVDDEPDAERMLPTETRTKLTIAKRGPQKPFASRRMLAMKTSEVNERKERRGIVR